MSSLSLLLDATQGGPLIRRAGVVLEIKSNLRATRRGGMRDHVRWVSAGIKLVLVKARNGPPIRRQIASAAGTIYKAGSNPWPIRAPGRRRKAETWASIEAL